MFADFLDFRWVPYPLTEWWFMGVMFVALLGLIGFLLVMRNRRVDDD